MFDDLKNTITCFIVEHNFNKQNFKCKEIKLNTLMFLKIDMQFEELDFQNLHFQGF